MLPIPRLYSFSTCLWPSLTRRLQSPLVALFQTNIQQTGYKWLDRKTPSIRLYTHLSNKSYLTIRSKFMALNAGSVGNYLLLQKMRGVDEKEAIAFGREFNNQMMRDFIQELVVNRDQEALQELITLLRNKNAFPGIDQAHLWEIDIRDALIQKRDLELIRAIFPLFCHQTRSCLSVFYKPIQQGDLELVQTLVEAGIKLRKKSSTGDILLYSLLERKLTILDYFLNHTDYNINHPYPFFLGYIKKPCQFGRKLAWHCITPAYLAVLMNDPQLLQALIDRGASGHQPNKRPDYADKNWISGHDISNPLLCAIEQGSIECFNILMTMTSINLNHQGVANKTALFLALEKDRFVMAQALIAKGADVNLSNAWFITPLMQAIYASDVATIKALIQARANPYCLMDDKQNLWHILARSSQATEIGELLVQAGIQFMIDEENEEGVTPLASAIDHYNFAAFKALLLYGADKNKKLQFSSVYRRELFYLKEGEEVTIGQLVEKTLKEEQLKDELYLQDRARHQKRIADLKEMLNLLDTPLQINPLTERTKTDISTMPKIRS